MGNLLRILLNPETPSKGSDIFVDFESAEPTDREQETWNLVQEVLVSARSILKELKGYVGASEEIRLAISNPRDEFLQEKAWEAVCPLVAKLKMFYEFSLKLEQVIPKLLRVLCSEDMTPKEHLEEQQALFKQFAEILDFVLKFDDLKMTNPAIQNDFSYYRRTLSRRKMANEDEFHEGEVAVSNEMANRMSLFYAQATPMLKTLSDITSHFVSQINELFSHVPLRERIKWDQEEGSNPSCGVLHLMTILSVHKELPVEQTTDCLSTMANICRVMIENPVYSSRFKSDETKFFCLRVMVGVIILYDHVHPVGAFAKTSGIEVKSSIKLLKDQEPGKVEGLLNALRYTTKHLQDESTPRQIKTLLA